MKSLFRLAAQLMFKGPQGMLLADNAAAATAAASATATAAAVAFVKCYCC